MRKVFLFAVLFSLFFGDTSCALKKGTYIALQDNRSKLIENLCINRNLLSYCGKKYGIYYTPLIYKDMVRHELEVFIVTEYGGKIVTTPEQKFYDLATSKYVQARNLTKQHLLMDKDGYSVGIKLVRIRASRLSDRFYSLTTFEPNTFFILDSSGHTILCHNALLECIFVAEKLYNIAGWVSVGVTASNASGLTNSICKLFSGRTRRASADSYPDEDKEKQHPGMSYSHGDAPEMWYNPENGHTYPMYQDILPEFILKNCLSEENGKIGKEAFEEFIKTTGGAPGGPNNNDPEELWKKFKKYLRDKNVLPHIFRTKKGHVVEPSENLLKRFIENIKPENRKTNLLFGKSKVEMFKSKWGRIGEIWSRTTDGKLDDAGINFFESLEKTIKKSIKITGITTKILGKK